LGIADWLIDDWGLTIGLPVMGRFGALREAGLAAPILQSAIINPPISNRQSTNRQSAVCNRQ
jgi:hypothetical protein